MSVAFDADCDGDQRDSGTDVCDDIDSDGRQQF